jgi:hypothetical protein
MSALVYRIYALLSLVLARVPVGTNLGLLHLIFALISGRFLASRGAVFPALDALGLAPEAVRRARLLAGWRQAVEQEGRFVPCEYEGIRPIACDLTAFFRPQLHGRDGKPLGSRHYVSDAGKALPALVFGLCVAVGRIETGQAGHTRLGQIGHTRLGQIGHTRLGQIGHTRLGQIGHTRLGLPRLMLRREAGQSEADLQRRLIEQAARTLAPEEALVVDAGFPLADLLRCGGRFVARARSNQTARRSALPAYKGRGRRPTRGELVRPLARTRAGQRIEATPPDATEHWQDGPHRLRAEVWNGLALPDGQPDGQSDGQSDGQGSAEKPGAPAFRLVAIHDRRYSQPLLLSSNLSVSAQALWRLYRDRWAIEQLPLSAKPMLGAERAFVFGQDSRYRLPELALLSGNLLSYVAATSTSVASGLKSGFCLKSDCKSGLKSGFWDRAARPTCGRLRRMLSRTHSAELPIPTGQLRKKDSVTAHLKTGVEAHRRHKAVQTPVQAPSEAAHPAPFTGN